MDELNKIRDKVDSFRKTRTFSKYKKTSFLGKQINKLSKFILKKLNKLIAWHNQRMFEKGLSKLTNTVSYKKYVKSMLKSLNEIDKREYEKFQIKRERELEKKKGKSCFNEKNFNIN